MDDRVEEEGAGDGNVYEREIEFEGDGQRLQFFTLGWW